MAKRNLTKLNLSRKRADIKQAAYEKAAREKKQKRQAIERDKDLVERWRALRSIGAYDTKENPALDKLTKSRRAAIQKKFEQVQNLNKYEDGEAFRPFHKVEKIKPVVIRDELGRTKKKYYRKSEAYKLDADHFQLLRSKTKAKIPNSIKTAKGKLIAKAPDEKIRISKSGKVETVKTTPGAKTVFTRLPLEGPLDFLTLMEDIKLGRLKLRKNERLELSSNGRKPTFYGQKDLKFLLEKLERYSTPGILIRADGSKGNFDDWANNASITKVYR